MIKICSLDLINREFFETDIMSADGKVLFSSTDKITPSIILKLYFKEIYVKEPLIEKPNQLTSSAKFVSVQKTEGVDLKPILIKAEETEEMLTEPKISEEESSESVDLDSDSVQQEAAESQENADITSATEYAASSLKKEEVPHSPVEIESITTDSSEELTNDGPRAIDGDNMENTEESADNGPRAAESSINTQSEKTDANGPRFVESNASVESEEIVKGPRAVEFEPEIETEDATEQIIGAGNVDIKTSKVNNHSKHQTATSEIVVEPVEISPEDMPLKFDEDEAKRMVENSLKIGKILKFSPVELKELEQVAYYYNIGITKFKKADLSRKGFRKMKIYASYEALLTKSDVPEKIAEMVKFCASNYEGFAFPLNQKIPCHNIVAITSFYEELLAKTGSKEETLLKMLQIGGNQFNIFILHKFIKLMRETNG